MLGQAARLVRRHMEVGQLLRGVPTDRCRPLLMLGGPLCAGLRASGHFAAREEKALRLRRAAVYCQDMWLKRPRAPACLLLVGEEHCLM